MDEDAQRIEVDRNYDAFQRGLTQHLVAHRGRFALMKEGEIVAFFDKPGEAYAQGLSRFAAQPFSIQEVTDEPIDLGFFSRVGG